MSSTRALGIAVRGIDRLERAERLADVVARDLAAEVVVEAARPRDRDRTWGSG